MTCDCVLVATPASLAAETFSCCDAGDCAIASSFVSYLGPFNKEFRELLITRDFYGGCVKLNIPVTKDMQVTKFLVDDSEVGEWTLQVHEHLVTISSLLLLVISQGITASQASTVLLVMIF